MTTYRQGSEKGDTTVTQLPSSTPKSWLAIALLSIASALLGACGGGGATATQNNNLADLDLLPGPANLYAGLPYTFTVVGGRAPYFVASSDFTIIPINQLITGNQFTVVAANPGVVDVGLDPNEVPRRTVSISVRDSNSGFAGTPTGTTVTKAYSVLQNFLTGYGVFYSSTCAGAVAGTAQACAGLESIVNVSPVTSGILSGGRAMRVERVTGDFDWVVEGTNTLQSTLNFTTDHRGIGIARLKVRVGAVTQIATFRLIDVASTLNVIQQFVITGGQPPGALTLVPNSLTFTAAQTTRCGTGSADVLIYDGQPPFTIQNSEPNLSVSPLVVPDLGGKFTVSAFNAALCLSGSTIVVSDNQGRRANLTVTTQAGTTAAPPLTVSPAAVTLTCAANVATVAVVGGAGANTAVSSSPRVTAVVSGTSMQITRLLADGATGPFPTAVTISVTDGATIATVSVTSPASCP
jgi:hypothetical protein